MAPPTITREQSVRLQEIIKRTQKKYGIQPRTPQSVYTGLKPVTKIGLPPATDPQYASPSWFDRTLGRPPGLIADIAKGLLTIPKELGKATLADIDLVYDLARGVSWEEASQEAIKEAKPLEDLTVGVVKSFAGTASRIPLLPVPTTVETDAETGERKPMLGFITPRGIIETVIGEEKGPEELLRVASEEAQRYYDAPLDALVEDVGNATLLLSAGAGAAGKLGTVARTRSAAAISTGDTAGAVRWADVASKASKARTTLEAARVGNVLDRAIPKNFVEIMEQKALNLKTGRGKTLGDSIRQSPKLTTWKTRAHRYGITTKGRAVRREAISMMDESIQAFNRTTRSEAEAIGQIRKLAKSRGINLPDNAAILSYLDENADFVYSHPSVASAKEGLQHRVRLTHDRLWAEAHDLPRNIVEWHTAIRMKYDDLASHTNNPLMTSELTGDNLTQIEAFVDQSADPYVADNWKAYLQAQKNIRSLAEEGIDMRYVDREFYRQRLQDIDQSLATETVDEAHAINLRQAQKKFKEKFTAVDSDIQANPGETRQASLSQQLGKRINTQREFLRQQVINAETAVKIKEGLIPSQGATHTTPGEFTFVDKDAAKAYENIYSHLSEQLDEAGLAEFVDVTPSTQAQLIAKRIKEQLPHNPEYVEIKEIHNAVRKQFKRDRARLQTEVRTLENEGKILDSVETPVYGSGKGWELRAVESDVLAGTTKPAFFGRPKKGEILSFKQGSGFDGQWRITKVGKDVIGMERVLEEAQMRGAVQTGTTLTGAEKRTLRRFNKAEAKTRAVTKQLRSQTAGWQERAARAQTQLDDIDIALAESTKDIRAIIRDIKTEMADEANAYVKQRIVEARSLGTRADEAARSILDNPLSYASPERVLMRVNRSVAYLQKHLDTLQVAPEVKQMFKEAETAKTLKELNASGVRVEYIHDMGSKLADSFADLMPETEGSPALVKGVTSKSKKATYRKKEGLMSNPERDSMLRFNADQLDTALEIIDRTYLTRLQKDYGLAENALVQQMPKALQAQYKTATTVEKQQIIRQMGYEVWSPEEFSGLTKTFLPDKALFMPEWIRGQLDAQLRGDFQFFRNGIGMVYDKVQGGWKTSVLALAPRWHVNNIVGGGFLSWALGNVPISKMPGLWVDAIRTYRNNGVITSETAKNLNKWLQKSTEGKLGVADIPDLLGYDPLSQAASPIVAELAPIGKSGITVASKEIPVGFKANMKHPVRSSKKFNAFIDNIVRQTVYMNHVMQKVDSHPQIAALRHSADDLTRRISSISRAERGPLLQQLDDIEREIASLSEPIIEKAVEYGNNTLGHFRKLGVNERYLLRRIFPFYVWMRHMAHTAFRMLKPENLNRTIALGYVAEIFGKPSEEEAKLPAYMNSMVELGFTVGGEPVFLNTRSLMPYSDILQPFMMEGRFTPEGAIQSISPVIKRPLELAGVKFPGPSLIPTKKEITPGGAIQEVGPGWLDMLQQDIPITRLARQLTTGNKPQFATGDPIIYKGAKAQPTAFAVTSYLGVPLRTANPAELSMKNYKTQMRALKGNLRFERRVLSEQGMSQQDIAAKLSRLPVLPKRQFEPSRDTSLAHR